MTRQTDMDDVERVLKEFEPEIEAEVEAELDRLLNPRTAWSYVPQIVFAVSWVGSVVVIAVLFLIGLGL